MWRLREQLKEFPPYAIRKAYRSALCGEHVSIRSTFIGDVKLATGVDVLNRRRILQKWVEVGMVGRSYWQIAFPALLVLLSFACFAVSFRVQDEQWRYDHPGQGHYYQVAAAMVLFVCVGMLLHFLRESARIIFGLLEIIFSAIFFYSSITNTDNILRALTSNHFTFASALVAVLALLAAAFYVFLCGLDNIGRGALGSPRLEKVRRWFRPQMP